MQTAVGSVLLTQNALLPIDRGEPVVWAKRIRLSLPQYAKASPPMLVTVDGIETLVKLLQL